MTTVNKIEWAKLLAEAISEPGKVNDAYRRFHGYSLGNRIWALQFAALCRDQWQPSSVGSTLDVR